MPRVTGGYRHSRKRKRILKRASGFVGQPGKNYRSAIEFTRKADVYAYEHRRQKKRLFRGLWITRLNAALKQRGVSYSRFIPALLEAGIEIYEYMPALLHAKTMVVDGRWATVGSANLINRSFAMDDEINVVVHDAAVAERLERIFLDDLQYARRVDRDEWRERGLGRRLLETLAVPVRALGVL